MTEFNWKPAVGIFVRDRFRYNCPRGFNKFLIIGRAGAGFYADPPSTACLRSVFSRYF